MSNFVFCLGSIVHLCHYRFSEIDHKICYFLGRLTTNSFQLQRSFAPLTPHQGLCPWTPLGAQPPDPHYRLATPVSLRGNSRRQRAAWTVMYSTGRSARHHSLNDLVWRAISKANIPAVKESSDLSRTDGKRPDGVTLVPWKSGRCVTWDVKVTDTLAQSYVDRDQRVTTKTNRQPGLFAQPSARFRYVVLRLDY